MLENILVARKCSSKTKVTVKSCVSAGLIALAVLLPQLVHLVLGASGGVQWLPMYLPVLIGGCLLGMKWGLGVGIASPLVSFLITSLWGSPMPAAQRLPFMVAELAVFALVSSLFGKKIAQNGWMAFPAVLLAQVSGRLFFLLLTAVFGSAASLSPEIVWGQIQTGLAGMVLQAVLVPFIVMGLKKILDRENQND